MFKNKKFIFLIIFLFPMRFFFIEKIHSEINTDSIIKIFCLENVKSEMQKANLKYQDHIGQLTCDCYLKNIKKEKSHEESISYCKLETKNKFNI